MLEAYVVNQLAWSNVTILHYLTFKMAILQWHWQHHNYTVLIIIIIICGRVKKDNANTNNDPCRQAIRYITCTLHSHTYKTRKLCYRKDDRAMCHIQYTWVPWKFSGLPDYAHGYYSQQLSRAFVRIDPLNVPTKFEVRSFIRSSDNRG